MFLVACSTAVGAVLLVPSYFLARVDQNAAASALAASTQALAATGNGSDTDTVAQVSERVSLMKSYPRIPRVAAILSLITAAIPTGISISEISVTPNDSGSDAIVLSGTAGTRDDLLAFADTLKAASALSGVSVPLSQLAGEANIPFTLSFSFTSPQS